MIFNFIELANKQQVLDEKIALNHNVTSKETIKQRILAFLVELGELANETRSFKYWSNKQASEREVILEEYVDGIHFLLSLANELKIQAVYNINANHRDLNEMFLNIYQLASVLKDEFNDENLTLLTSEYLNLGYLLGFNENDIIKGYCQKNEKNHLRQESNY